MTPEVAIALASLILKGGAELASMIGAILADSSKSAEERAAALVLLEAELRAVNADVQAT